MFYVLGTKVKVEVDHLYTQFTKISQLLSKICCRFRLVGSSRPNAGIFGKFFVAWPKLFLAEILN